MFNRLIQSFENITTAILARFVKYDHNIDGSHKDHINASNYSSFANAVIACGPAGSKNCRLVVTNTQIISTAQTVLSHITVEVKNGGKFKKSGTGTLSIENLIAGSYKIFDGFSAGNVTLGGGTPIVNVSWFGAEGDDAEYAPEIQSAVDSKETTGGIIVINYGKQGLYDINTQIDIPSKITIEIDKNIIISSALTSGGVFNFNGSISGSTLALTSNADEFDLSVEMSSGNAATLTAEDMVLIKDPTTVDGGVYYQVETNIVESIAGTTVTFKYPLNFDYTTANSSWVQKLTPVIDSKVKGGTIDLSDSASGSADGITGTYIKDCRSEGIKVIGHRGMAIEFWYGLRCLIRDLGAAIPQDITAGHGYGGRLQYCRHSDVIGGYGVSVRHTADITGGSDINITQVHAIKNGGSGSKTNAIGTHGLRSKRIKMYGNTIENSERGFSVGNPTFDADYDVIIENNTISKCEIGIYLLENSSRVQVLGNNIRESIESAIALQDAANAIIMGNRCKGSTAANSKGLINIFDSTDIEIAENTITTSDLSGIKMASVSEIDIHNNRIATSTEESIVGTVLTGKVRVVDNEITQDNAYDTISLDGSTNRTIVTDNDILGGASVTNGIKVVDAGDAIIDGNTISTVIEGVRIENSDHPKIRQNYIDNVTNGVRLASGTINTCVVDRNVITSYTARFVNTVSAVNYGNNQLVGEGTAAPVAGAWERGDMVRNTTPSAGGTPGWVCVAAGTPGTWKAMASVAA